MCGFTLRQAAANKCSEAFQNWRKQVASRPLHGYKCNAPILTFSLIRRSDEPDELASVHLIATLDPVARRRLRKAQRAVSQWPEDECLGTAAGMGYAHPVNYSCGSKMYDSLPSAHFLFVRTVSHASQFVSDSCRDTCVDVSQSVIAAVKSRFAADCRLRDTKRAVSLPPDTNLRSEGNAPALGAELVELEHATARAMTDSDGHMTNRVCSNTHKHAGSTV